MFKNVLCITTNAETIKVYAFVHVYNGGKEDSEVIFSRYVQTWRIKETGACILNKGQRVNSAALCMSQLSLCVHNEYVIFPTWTALKFWKH